MFAKALLEWYENHKRDLPWRGIRDPYIIWLSEIILQQTRISQGLPYFLRFQQEFPTVSSFAKADLSHILRLWQGLGYYSRARNMHHAALQVMEEYDGVFPKDYNDLIKLKGVGEYTAAAISSFSQDEAHAVLDGNVFRVLARYFEIDTPINSSAGKKEFLKLAYEMLDTKQPGKYNQAIMDFGSMQCRPHNPDCENCVLRLNCRAFQNQTVHQLPVKLKKKASKSRYLHYFILQKENKTLMSQRDTKDVWAKLYEFPHIETEKRMSLQNLLESDEFKNMFDKPIIYQIGKEHKHILSHQTIFAKFFKVENPHSLKIEKPSWNYYLSDNLDKLAKHKLIFNFLDTNTL